MKDVHLEVGELDLPPSELEQARSVLSARERERAARFLRDEDRARFIAARAMLRHALARELGVPPAQLEFVYGGHGKPALAAPFGDGGLRFNLSHSAGRALLAFAYGRELGVDLEKVRPVRFGAKIARRFFTEEEQRALDGLTAAAWDEGFFRCWTRKEAFIKAVGDGLSYPLKSFSVPMGPAAMDEDVRVHGAQAAQRLWSVSVVDAGPGFLGAIVAERTSGCAHSTTIETSVAPIARISSRSFS